jgi:hypothetical protein
LDFVDSILVYRVSCLDTESTELGERGFGAQPTGFKFLAPTVTFRGIQNCRRHDGRVRRLTVSPHSLKCVRSLDSKQAQLVCAFYSLLGKKKVEQHLAIVDHFFKTPNLKSDKSQKAQSDNDDKFNMLLECAQKKIEAQIAQSQ